MVQVKVFGTKWERRRGGEWVGRIQVRVMGLELRVGDLPDSGSGKPPPEGCRATQRPKNSRWLGDVLGRTRRKTGELPKGFSSWKMFV